MNSRFIFYVLIILYTTSCKNQELIPGFEIGMTDQELTESIEKAVSNESFKSSVHLDTSEFEYQWIINSQPLYSTVSFNNDGLSFGNLRICVIDITDPPVLRTVSEPFEDVEHKILDHESIIAFKKNANETSLSYSTCPTKKYQIVMTEIEKRYGKEDSTTYRIVDFFSGTDTAYYYHHFHDVNSRIIVRTGKLLPATNYINFPHINSVLIYELSNSYELDLQVLIEQERSKLRPENIITIPITYTISEEVNKWGFEDTYLEMFIYITPDLRKSIVDYRSINSLKGVIYFYDQFHDVLDSVQNIELNTSSALPPKGEPGLRFALGESEPYTFTPVQYKPRLKVNHQNVSQNLREAVKNRNKLKIEFLPKYILFEDGTVLK